MKSRQELVSENDPKKKKPVFLDLKFQFFASAEFGSVLVSIRPSVGRDDVVTDVRVGRTPRDPVVGRNCEDVTFRSQKHPNSWSRSFQLWTISKPSLIDVGTDALDSNLLLRFFGFKVFNEDDEDHVNEVEQFLRIGDDDSDVDVDVVVGYSGAKRKLGWCLKKSDGCLAMT